MKKIIIAVLLFSVYGCASYTGVVPMGDDTYMIAKQQATGFPGLGNMKAEIITDGTNFCSGRGKDFKLISSKETQPPYVLGNYPRSEIEFKCIEPITEQSGRH